MARAPGDAEMPEWEEIRAVIEKALMGRGSRAAGGGKGRVRLGIGSTIKD